MTLNAGACGVIAERERHERGDRLFVDDDTFFP